MSFMTRLCNLTGPITKINQSDSSIVSTNFVLGPVQSLAFLLRGRLHINAAFWMGIMVLTQITRSHFKQSKISLLIPPIYVLGCFVNFWRFLGIFGDKKFFSKD